MTEHRVSAERGGRHDECTSTTYQPAIIIASLPTILFNAVDDTTAAETAPSTLVVGREQTVHSMVMYLPMRLLMGGA